MILLVFLSPVYLVTVIKSYKYDWNTVFGNIVLTHTTISTWIFRRCLVNSAILSPVGSGWNYACYEVINYYTGGY